MQKAFQNRKDQILGSYTITDFSELHQELLKAGQSQPAGFENRQIFFQINNSLLKVGSAGPATFKNRPGPILPVFKIFSQIQKLFALNSSEFINSI